METSSTSSSTSNFYTQLEGYSILLAAVGYSAYDFRNHKGATMKAILCLIVLVPVTVFAQATRRERLEERLLDQSRKVRQLIKENINLMGERDLVDAYRLLEDVETLARGAGPAPLPQPRPYPPRIMCSDDIPTVFQGVFQSIKAMAYSGSGLNYTDSNATAFATTWTRSNPCREAAQFIKNIQRLKAFAYSGTGLNYTDSNAAQYALTMESKFCSHMDLEGVFSQHYNFAYSSTGLNYTASNAVSYAKGKVEPVVFSCKR